LLDEDAEIGTRDLAKKILTLQTKNARANNFKNWQGTAALKPTGLKFSSKELAALSAKDTHRQRNPKLNISLLRRIGK